MEDGNNALFPIKNQECIKTVINLIYSIGDETEYLPNFYIDAKTNKIRIHLDPEVILNKESIVSFIGTQEWARIQENRKYIERGGVNSETYKKVKEALEQGKDKKIFQLGFKHLLFVIDKSTNKNLFCQYEAFGSYGFYLINLFKAAHLGNSLFYQQEPFLGAKLGLEDHSCNITEWETGSSSLDRKKYKQYEIIQYTNTEKDLLSQALKRQQQLVNDFFLQNKEKINGHVR
jgi:hypothetical protein